MGTGALLGAAAPGNMMQNAPAQMNQPQLAAGLLSAMQSGMRPPPQQQAQQQQAQQPVSPALLVAAQQLLQQLSQNLARRGMDMSALSNAGINLFPMALAAQQQLQQATPNQQPQQQNPIQLLMQGFAANITNTNAASAAAPQQQEVASAAAPAAAAAAATSASTDPLHPPIHPGASSQAQGANKPEYTTIPCRARGMPPDHNSSVCFRRNSVGLLVSKTESPLTTCICFSHLADRIFCRTTRH